ncbi:MAG: DUF4282 domain-containing protein [Cocleimonas sp.]|nr:DUF4282 domain-containing protein [Cocleimonas sp.]
MDFLTFKQMISIEVLIVFYYLGVFIFPLVSFFLFSWLIKKYKLLNIIGSTTKKMTWGLLNKKNKIVFVAISISLFLFMQLIWRMIFEFLIAYIQIRDALLNTPL